MKTLIEVIELINDVTIDIEEEPLLSSDEIYELDNKDLELMLGDAIDVG